jgi:hypothetical protein
MQIHAPLVVQQHQTGGKRRRSCSIIHQLPNEREEDGEMMHDLEQENTKMFMLYPKSDSPGVKCCANDEASCINTYALMLMHFFVLSC